MKARTYYTLLERDATGNWYPQFGDYDRATVQAERDDYRSFARACDLKVIATGDGQEAIDAALAKLNATI